MPYIKQARRYNYVDLEEIMDTYPIDGPGELNYCLTLLIKKYIDCNLMSYQTINDVIGALEGAKLEFYRRVVVPYEDEAIKRNGDVY